MSGLYMTRVEQMAVSEGNSKARYNGQGKMNFGQGKVSENSWNIISN